MPITPVFPNLTTRTLPTRNTAASLQPVINPSLLGFNPISTGGGSFGGGGFGQDPLLALVFGMFGLMFHFLQQALGGSLFNPAAGTGATGTPGVAGTTPTGTAAAGGVPGATAQSPLTQDDFVDYLLAGSQGGTQGTSERIEGRFARPGSRFATAGPIEFKAATASAYASQFKGFALGLDVAFNPGDNINQLAANIAQAQSTPFTAEAELLSKVAAIYRGDLTGGINRYNNAALRNVLLEFGRADLANLPGVGNQFNDVASVGAVVAALNQEQDLPRRQALLQRVFDFAGNTPSSPSGAVPNLGAYQRAIQIVRNGTLDRLLQNYAQGIRTTAPLFASPANPAGEFVTTPLPLGSAGAAGNAGTGLLYGP